MSLTKLKTRHWREQFRLKSKQDLMVKPYESTHIASKISTFLFKFFILSFFAFIIIFPFYFMLQYSLTDKIWQDRSPEASWLWPQQYQDGLTYTNYKASNFKISLHFENYVNAFQAGYFQSLVFTAAITTLSILVRLFFSMTLGYALSMRKWKGKSVFFNLFISLMVLPEIALLTGQYYVVTRLGWGIKSGSEFSGWLFVTFVIPFAASIFFSYMYKNAFEEIPDSVKESSMLDGASSFKYFIKIALPMVNPTTWTVAILTAFASWNSYTWPALIMNTTKTLWSPMNIWVFTTGKDYSTQQTIVYTSIKMAATFLAILPMLIIYFILRKRIMKAISRQGRATKG
ncbi:carbohydrate ABC transporter permease [[Mycoplasma] falconis]|uniref:Carbohydrate ABC transporter permease n=1 Tax=[Mycoplasma] falconis TaxID=92403 RepID=A0A501XC77_9BACT|nr:carbohydrate ABC transporter permease [[Mycoplasma] falconis]TPE58039.1 carbohydrate ABC transporter permease [[Mycoplasma] falconis]